MYEIPNFPVEQPKGLLKAKREHRQYESRDDTMAFSTAERLER
jgi:hypothetical protein